jgi:hypothetical protein
VVCCTYFNIQKDGKRCFGISILATVLATFPNIGRNFVEFSGHSGSVKNIFEEKPPLFLLLGKGILRKTFLRKILVSF